MAEISSRNILFLIGSLLSVFSLLITPSKADEYSVACERGTNYTQQKTPFQTNLLSALSLLDKASSSARYLNASVGSGPDTAHATFMCRLDLPLATCRDCVGNATSDLQAYCPGYWAAADLLKECAVQYANHSMFWATGDSTLFSSSCENPNLGDPSLRKTVEKTMSDLIENVDHRSNNMYYFGTGEGSYMEYQTLHALVQCSPEYTAAGCRGCLRDSMKSILNWCDATIGATSFGIGCGIKYSLYGFYNTTAGNSRSLLAPPPPPLPNSSPALPPGILRTIVLVGLLVMKARVYL